MPRIDRFTNDDLTFTVTDSGPEDGVPVVLLHGFPQTAESWAEVAGFLNAAGYRTVVPNQRGYCPQAAPPRRSDYRIDKLVGDIVAMIDQSGVGAVHLVGHDWGAAVAWAVAAARPDLLRSLTAVSVPHPMGFMQAMLTSTQLFKSWYMLMFQLPWLPEAMARKDDGMFYRMLRRTGQQHAAAVRDVRAIQRGRTATGAVNWYRALPFAVTSVATLRRPITVPTLQIWSDGDTAVGRKGHDLSQKFVRAPWRLMTLPASHWIPDEAPHELADLIAAHARQTV